MVSLLAELLIIHLLKCKKEELLFQSIWWDTCWSAKHKSYCLSQSDRTPPEVQDGRVTVWINLMRHLLKCKTQKLLFESIWWDTWWSAKHKSYCLSQSDRTPPEVQYRRVTVWVNLLQETNLAKWQHVTFWDIRPCSPLNVNRLFRGTRHVHIQVVLSSGI
jgi:hypothetical protein